MIDTRAVGREPSLAMEILRICVGFMLFFLLAPRESCIVPVDEQGYVDSTVHILQTLRPCMAL